MASHILPFHLWPAVALSPLPPASTVISAFGIPVGRLQVPALAQERQEETQLHLLAGLLIEPQPNRKLLSKMLLCVDSKALEIRSGRNMLITPCLLELLKKKKIIPSLYDTEYWHLKNHLSFKTWQISTTFAMTTIATQRERKIGKHLL